MISEDEWLPKARRLAVGMRSRVFHRRELRPNLVIGNDMDKWWCYCHACHEGGVVEKQHVILGERGSVADMNCKLPDDIKDVYLTEYEIPIARFLADKNMSYLYLPNASYSESRKRLMILLEGKWHGRDLTGRSPSKWMNYSNAHLVGKPAKYTVVVEDLFSMCKVQWCLREYADVGVLCNLGTNASLQTAVALSSDAVQEVAWFFDADRAGDAGAKACMRRNAVHGKKQHRVRPPEGMDPKDMTCAQILTSLKGAFKL